MIVIDVVCRQEIMRLCKCAKLLEENNDNLWVSKNSDCHEEIWMKYARKEYRKKMMTKARKLIIVDATKMEF